MVQRDSSSLHPIFDTLASAGSSRLRRRGGQKARKRTPFGTLNTFGPTQRRSPKEYTFAAHKSFVRCSYAIIPPFDYQAKEAIMALLILIRHGESQWNLENRFTGWVDVELSDKGRREAEEAGKKLKGFNIDKAYTSVLKRAMDTLDIAMKTAGKTGIPITRAQALNERHYGDLQGLNKAETAKKYGDEQVHIWRRSYDVAPPGPGGESLKDTAARTLPYFREHILKDIRDGKNVIVAAHGNSLRSIVMELDRMTREQVLELNIPTGVPIVYEFAPDLTLKSKETL